MVTKIKNIRSAVGLLVFVGVFIFAALYLSPYVYLLGKQTVVFHTDYDGEYGGMSLYHWGILTPLTPPDYYTSESVAERSPDGSKIAFTYWRKLESEDTYFALLDMKTHEITPIAHVSGGDGLSYQYPGEPYVIQFAWSPDGNKILYSMPVSKDGQELRLFDVETGGSESTSIFLGSMLGEEKVILGDLAWYPGPMPLASIRYDGMHPPFDRKFKLFYIDSEFVQLGYVIDGSEADWLSDGKAIMYQCVVNSRGNTNTCVYSFETKEKQIIGVDLSYWQSSPSGLFVFAWTGAGEGERSYLVMYNRLLQKSYRYPQAFSNLFGYFLLR